MTLLSHHQSESSVSWSAQTEQPSLSDTDNRSAGSAYSVRGHTAKEHSVNEHPVNEHPVNEQAVDDHSGLSASAEKRPVDEAESLLWLLHQQSQACPVQYAVAYRLPVAAADGAAGTDTGRLVTALMQVCRQHPALRTVYRFDDQMGLYKTDMADFSPVIVEPVAGEQQAVARLASLRARPFDLARQPGIQFVVLMTPDALILGGVIHQILSSKASPGSLFSMVASLYNGQPVSFPAMSEQLNPQTLMLPDTIVAAGVPGLNRHPAVAEVKSVCPRNHVRNSVCPRNTAEEDGEMAGAHDSAQFSVSLHLKPLAGLLASAGQTPAAVLTVLSTIIARQLAAVCGQPVVRVCVPAEAVPSVDALYGCLTGKGLKTLTLDCSQPDTLLSQAAQQMQASDCRPYQADGAAHLPQVLLMALSDPAADFAGLQAQRFWLPVQSVPFELTCSVVLSPQGEDTLMLTTAESLSAYAGGWLLERLAAAVCGHSQANIQPVMAENGMHSCESGETGAGESVTAELALSGLSVPEEPDLFSASSSGPAFLPVILNAFREALNAPDMTEHDDFFDMGGHSLIATRVIGQLLNDHQIEIRMNDLFRYATPLALAAHAIVQGSGQSGGGMPEHGNEISPVQTHPAPVCVSEQPQSGPFPLSHAQHAMWTVVQKFAAMGLNHVFNIPFTLHFPDGVDEPALFQAFRDLLIRHPGLRTHFEAGSDGPVQRIVSVSELDEYQWFRTSEDTVSEPFRDALNREAAYGFDLAHELPLRLRFIRDSEAGELYLSMLFHHLVLDEWSVNLMMDELAQAYQSRTGGQAPEWCSEPLPFHIYAQQQAAQGINQQHLEFWLNHLQGAQWAQPVFDEDHPLHEPASQSAAGEGGWVEFRLEPEVSDGLHRQARANNASLFNVVYAAIVSSLYLLGNTKEMVVGTPVSGRMDAAFFDTVGYFTTIAVHRVLPDDQLCVRDMIQQVKQTINDSMPYTDIPVDVMESALFGADKDKQPGHMFEVMIQLHAKNKLHGSLVSAEGYRVKFSQVDPEKQEAALGLQFEVMEETVDGEPQIRVLMSYLSQHYSPAQVTLLREATHQVLNTFAAENAAVLSLSAIRQQLEPLLPDHD
ncbi:Linear gramicidin synthase subunit B [Vibrio aerogenes CECT 7868]|uniref:Linear gramicidin synthase subunit B n=1 Tax=Vibrio aerogenes CECT 7868 TaxID=1216006 RepID=A0A1M5XBW2_9VIBR|nr:condensation domain-containing protein [Vibrio aerogenes]SHH97357.1 Linear gramicidin synthase subunit B [Vibrio aerogenes CECT 7868]